MRSASLGINPYHNSLILTYPTPMHTIPRKYWISTSEFITSSISTSHTTKKHRQRWFDISEYNARGFPPPHHLHHAEISRGEFGSKTPLHSLRGALL